MRDVLNRIALRRMAVLRPLKLVIENYPVGRSEELDAINHPDDPSAGIRRIPFGRELYIEREDFTENPPRNFHRLATRARGAAALCIFVTCREVVKNTDGEIVELRCTYDPQTPRRQCSGRAQGAGDAALGLCGGRVPAEVRLYNQLFATPVSRMQSDFVADLNPNSLELIMDARLEPALAEAECGAPVQFERQGYFCRDPSGAPDKVGLQPHGRTSRYVGQGTGREQRVAATCASGYRMPE